MLLGDPALQLPILTPNIRLATTGSISPGARITIKGVLPEPWTGATVRVTLERPIASLPTDLEALPDGPGETRNRIMTKNHQRANTVVLATQEIKSNDVYFECRVDLPGKIPWKNLILRASAATETESALGIETLHVKKKGK